MSISSQEWREKVEDENLKSWLYKSQRFKDKRKVNIID